MSDLKVVKYTAERQCEWDEFVKTSKNGTFLLQRGFMDYHHHRFSDFSLMIYKAGKPIALFPANRQGHTLYSHQGLTYGGLLMPPTIKFSQTLKAFKALLVYLEKENVTTVQLSPAPKIYHTSPADELDYLFFLVKAERVKVQLSAAIYSPKSLNIQANRLEGVKKAQKAGLHIEKSEDFTTFWEEILKPNLKCRHNAVPVHTDKEIACLAQEFPANIHQYNVYQGDKMVGGTTLFDTDTVVHVQYISADENRQQLGTLDFLCRFLIEEAFAEKPYFDFGTSNQGHHLNAGLLYWKECFGARSIVYETYTINPANHHLLDTAFLNKHR